ncbi:MAG: circularly permuted type 2 ATP-grasp protein [Nostocoides sp.]
MDSTSTTDGDGAGYGWSSPGGVTARGSPATALGDYLRRDSQYVLRIDAAPAAFHEVGDGGSVRPSWEPIVAAMRTVTPAALPGIVRRAERLLEDDGVTYNRLTERTGPDGQVTTRTVATPWWLDVMPVVLDAGQWADLREGLDQRARLLDAILTDLYGQRRLLSNGLLPPSLVLAHAGYLRSAHGITLPGSHQLTMMATDLGRAPDGTWQVIADRTQAPSGSAYAMENRRVMSRLFPGIYHDVQIERLLPFFQAYRQAVLAAAPPGAMDPPQAVVLSPGAHSETAFDQAYLASLLGFPLVEAPDLVVRDGRVWLRALGRLDPVDVVIRRVDASYADPLFLRPDSHLGVPGLVEAAHRGTVSILNGFGTGVLENAGLMAFLPQLARHLLGEDLALPSVTTYWCGDEAQRSHVLSHLPEMVIRPIDRGRAASVFAGDLSSAQRADLVARVQAQPYAWVGQDLLSLSVTPTVAGQALVGRPTTLRTFAVATPDGYFVLPGGVARVPATGQDTAYGASSAARAGAPTPGAQDLAGHFVGRARASISKDVWVLAEDSGDPGAAGWLHDGPASSPADGYLAMSPRVLSDLFWAGRYATRAEDLIRLLLAARELSGDLRATPSGAAGAATSLLRQAVTEVTTTYPGFLDPTMSPSVELRSLIVDAGRSGTFAHSTVALGEALQGVRDQLSQDVWLVLGIIERAVADLRHSPDESGAQLVDTAERSLSGLLGLSGVVLDTMTHDPGWHLLNAGRRAERALGVLALLRATICQQLSGPVDALVANAVLGATESSVTYRRRYRGRAHLEGVLDLLLFDIHNPRSVIYQLHSLTDHLPQVAADTTEPSPAIAAAAQVSGQLTGVDAVVIARPDPDGWRGDLYDYLTDVHDGILGICAGIEASYLRSPGVPRQMVLGPTLWTGST